MKRIYDPAFRYTPSYATDVGKTFERLRRERAAGQSSVRAQAPDANVLRLPQPRKAASE